MKVGDNVDRFERLKSILSDRCKFYHGRDDSLTSEIEVALTSGSSQAMVDSLYDERSYWRTSASELDSVLAVMQALEEIM